MEMMYERVGGLDVHKATIVACDTALEALRSTRRYPQPVKTMTVRETFRRVGADEWEPFREQFKNSPARAAE